jgi:hypothetical protein
MAARMPTFRFNLRLALLLSLVFAATESGAAQFTWHLNNVASSTGTTFAGSFTIDTTSNSVVGFNITVGGNPGPGPTFPTSWLTSNTNSWLLTTSYDVVVFNQFGAPGTGEAYYIGLKFGSSLATTGGPIHLTSDAYLEYRPARGNRIYHALSGQALASGSTGPGTTVPEPNAALLFGIGSILVAARQRSSIS